MHAPNSATEARPEMGSKWFNYDKKSGHVTAWSYDDKATKTYYNLSDSTGEHPTSGARFKKLAPELQQKIKEACAEAKAEAHQKREARNRSSQAIANVWRADMTRYEESKDAWAMIERTLAGTNFAQAKDCAELPTYQDHQFGKALTGHAYDTRLSCYYGRLIDGGIVIDINHVLDERPGLAVSSPMLDTHRKTPERFQDSIASESWLLDVFASDPANGFCGLARLAKVAAKTDFGGFDYLPLSMWLAWWKERGARIGKREGNQIIWEDGTAEDIRPEAERWQVNGQCVTA